MLGQGLGWLVPLECLFIKEIAKHISTLADVNIKVDHEEAAGQDRKKA